MNLCRLCGEEKSSLDFIVELNDNSISNWSYRDLIEYHSRVVLKKSKLLPQTVCEECRRAIDDFAKFSKKLQVVQNTFNAENDKCFVEIFPETEIKQQVESDDDTNINEEESSSQKRKLMLNRISINEHHLDAACESKYRLHQVNKQRKKDLKNSFPSSLAKGGISENPTSEVETESELESADCDSDCEGEISSDNVPLKRKKKRSPPSDGVKVSNCKRRPNNRHSERQSIYGSEIDSPEKLFAEEIVGNSVFSSSLHLNITVDEKPSNGEISEDLAASQGLNPLRWRDLLVCAVCKIQFINIMGLTEHIAKHHGSRTRAYGCFNCDIEYGALYESSLVNHLVERHYYEHLKFCCLVCSKLFYDFLSLVRHYKIHKDLFDVLVCFICGFYAKTLDDLKEHKAYHIQMENSKPENQTVCEMVLSKYNDGVEPNTYNFNISDSEKNQDGSVTVECQQRFVVDWSFAQYQCPLCYVKLKNPFELFVHLRLKHPKEQDRVRKIYKCDICIEKKDFSGMHYFLNHSAESHYESLRFTCVVCSKLFWNYLALANHYKNVHPSFTSVFCCHCGKLFHSITSAAIHYKKIMILLTEEEKKLKKDGKLETEHSTHICHVCGKSCKNNVSKNSSKKRTKKSSI